MCVHSEVCFEFQEDVKLLSHLLRALDLGAPPHGGIALGKQSIWAQFIGGGGGGEGVKRIGCKPKNIITIYIGIFISLVYV